MVKLTSNEEKVRKKLEKFPQGAKANQLMRELFMSKTPLYNALNSLEMKELAFRGEHNLWFPSQPLSIQPKKQFGFFEWRDRIAERERLERKQELKELQREDDAETEIMQLHESDPEFEKKKREIERKYGLR